MTDEERMAAVQEYLDGKGTLPEIAKKYSISYSVYRRLVLRAKSEGIEAIKISSTKKNIRMRSRKWRSVIICPEKEVRMKYVKSIKLVADIF